MRESLPHHDRAGADRGVEADDLALAERLDALDRAPFAHRIDFERALLELRFFPALGEILDPARDALRIVFGVFDGQTLVGKEALLERDPPGPVVGVAVALQTDDARHGTFLSDDENRI